ncbi:hypothetical protein SAMN04515671_3122 [Nakamurella panacisegetis]|uniref:DNA-binding transcriptional regulator of glucitol operon n=1 Tax=Nakamurella panacisegetis TaxID=1090615 RepID=A0A1H0QKB8_9ACTN|nr:hypothetical protein [Nakamurella panacisegetis]SDP17515.1 hypothetical protein SAMN04515671_3122 [Nakamurella panacisegetis]
MYRRFLRPGWFVGHLLVFLAVLVCLRLGWWQWDRTHEATGTVQNLGYAVLWPIFAAAFIYMWVRFLQLEVLKDEEDDAELTRIAAGGEPRTTGTPDDSFEATPATQTDHTPSDVGSAAPDDDVPPVASAIPAAPVASARRTPSRGRTVAVSTVGDENPEQDPELAAYNRALADLAEKDRRRAR